MGRARHARCVGAPRPGRAAYCDARGLTPDQRAALLPHFTDDVLLLEKLTGESWSDWLDLDVGRFGDRTQLRPAGLIGTAHQSIDRPIRD